MPTTTPHVYPAGVECRKSDPPDADPAWDSSLPGPPAHARRKNLPASRGFPSHSPVAGESHPATPYPTPLLIYI